MTKNETKKSVTKAVERFVKNHQKRIIVENIKYLLKENGMNQSELADRIGVAKSTISDYMNYRSKPGAGVLEKMAEVFGVSKSDIDTTYKNTSSKIIDGKLVLVQESPEEYTDNKKIPILGKIAAGIPVEAIEDIVDSITPPYPSANIDDLYGLVVHGESMNRIIPNGNYAVLKKQPDVENGEIAAVVINGNYATLKRVYKFTDLIVLEPCSYDPSFKDQQYSSDTCDDIQIIGKYLYSVSPMFN